jgi:hypothetical protein
LSSCFLTSRLLFEPIRLFCIALPVAVHFSRPDWFVQRKSSSSPQRRRPLPASSRRYFTMNHFTHTHTHTHSFSDKYVLCPLGSAMSVICS